MTKPTYILNLNDRAWTIAIVGVARQRKIVRLGVPTPETAGEKILESLRGEGFGTEALLVALPPYACFAVPLEHDGPARRRSSESMTYELEPSLPWAAEEIVADFLPIGPTRSLAIVTRLEPIQTILRSLESAGIRVEWVVPAALLALQHVLDSAKQSDVLLWEDDGIVHLFGLKSGRPTTWLTAPTPFELRQQLEQASNHAESIAVATIHWDPTVDLVSLINAPVIATEIPAITVDAAAEQTALAIMSGQLDPLVNLRTGQLAPPDPLRQIRGSLNALVSVFLLMLISAFVAMILRSSQYDSIAAEQESKQRLIYQRLYPQQQPPLDILARLRSDHRRLKGLSGTHDDLKPEPSATAILYATLTAIPKDLRFRLLDITIENGKVLLDGEARSHSDAESIVAALRQRGGLRVDAPRSENRTDSGTSFSITATVQSGVRSETAK